jgi:hypothetical protein
MADLNKFEQMLEKLVNEDKAGAEELFHEIVVEKSRDIYEGLLEAELEDDEVDEATDEEVDESDDELDETDDEEVDESDDELDEDFNLDEFEVEADPMDAMMSDMEVDGGDEAPAMDMGDEEGEGDVEDRVEDLEDALEELKAEFEAMMGDNDDGEEANDDADDMDMDADDDGEEAEEEAMAFETADEEVEETADEEVEETKKSAGETMREYVEKVNATMGDNGANTKSATATPNHIGDGTAANLAQGADEKGGKADSAKDMSTGNVNVPGGKAAKSNTPNAKGHGAEKKGAGETADNKKSTIGK